MKSATWHALPIVSALALGGCAGSSGPSPSALPPPTAGGAVAAQSRTEVALSTSGGWHGIVQGNGGSNWVTLSNTYMLAGDYPIVPGKHAMYYAANFGTNSDPEPQTIGTMSMAGVASTYETQPSCGYGTTQWPLYYTDIVLNHEGETVVATAAWYRSTWAMLWSFLRPDGTQGTCHTLVGATDNATGMNPMATGPSDTIWGVGSTGLWRFAKNGTQKHFLNTGYPNGAGIVLVTQGPDGVMWAHQGNQATLIRIDPTNGTLLSSYTVPNGCTYISSIATVKNLMWGLAQSCIFSVTSGGTVKAYQVASDAGQYGGSQHGLVQGPDGKPWFVTQINGQQTQEVLGTLDPSNGNVTLYPLPQQNVDPQNVATGPDGNLWVTTTHCSSCMYGSMFAFVPNPLTVSPSPVTLPRVGAKQHITASEKGATTWTARSQNPSIATVVETKTSGVFTVTATGVGSTTVTVADKAGNSVLVPVTVQ